MSRKLRVGVLFGGQSGEHDVSLVSAGAIMKALETSDRFEVVPIGIARDGRWIMHPDAHTMLAAESRLRLGGKSSRPVDTKAISEAQAALVPGGKVGSLIEVGKRPASPGRIDVIFPVLHGPKGEDGTVQGFLELAGIPYVGAGVAGSAIGMDKDIMKRLFRDGGIKVADWELVHRSEWRRDPKAVVTGTERIGYPCFVKPANMGSSVGISRVGGADELRAAIDEAARYDTKIIVEEAIDAREIECSVLGNENPRASVPGEIIPAGDFYDYASKYVDAQSELLIPADLPADLTAEIQKLALLAFQTVDGAGMARVDFLVDRKSGRVYLNELNTIPGFTPISMYTKLWEASGLSYGRLIEELIELALERHADRADIETEFDIPSAD